METELLPPVYNESEVQEKAIRRSQQIRDKYGSRANFLKLIEKKNSDPDQFVYDFACQIKR